MADHRARIEALRMERDRLQVRNRDLEQVAKAVVPIADVLERPCWYDHHGYCQAHWMHEKPCPVEALDAALANRWEDPL